MPSPRRKLLLALTASTLVALGGGAAIARGPQMSIADLMLAARRAHDARSYRAYREHARELYRRLDGEADTVFALAKAEALLGHPSAALRWLRTLAVMGQVRDLAAEPDLAGLRDDPALAEIGRRMAENRRPVARSRLLFTLQEKDLVVDDIAFDGASRTYYLGSVRHRKIVAVDSAGRAADFVPEGRDGLWAVLGLGVDPRRKALWATTAALPQGLGYDPANPATAGRSALLRYSLADGHLEKRFDLPADGGGHVLGDLTVSESGDVFVSDSAGGGIYTVRHGRDVLEPLVAPGTFRSPQTPAATPDGRRLFVPIYGRGIAILDLATRRITWVAHAQTLAVGGIDGLYLTGRTLLAIQNDNEPMRVVRFDLDPTLTRIVRSEVIERATPALGSPTHGVLVDGGLDFIGNSGWEQMGDDGPPKPGAVFTAPVVLRSPPLRGAA